MYIRQVSSGVITQVGSGVVTQMGSGVITITPTKRQIKISRTIISVTLHGDPKHPLQHTFQHSCYEPVTLFHIPVCWIESHGRAVR